MTVSSNNNNIETYLNNDAQINSALKRLAIGEKITQAADDAASLAISAQLTTQASGLSQSLENANSALALTQVGGSALNEQSNILNGIRKDLLQASTATTSQEGREAALENIQSSLQQLNNIASSTNYNGTNLLQESQVSTGASSAQEFQVGTDSNNIVATTGSIQANTEGLGLNNLLNQNAGSFDAQSARDYLDDIDQALDTLSGFQADFGSVANQLGSANANLASQYTNTQAANSVIKDSDYAKESIDFSRESLTSQIGSIVLAQSNNINQQSVSRLLQ